MSEALGIGTVVKRTGDVWKGAPGCSLTTTIEFKETSPDLTQKVVRAFVRGVKLLKKT